MDKNDAAGIWRNFTRFAMYDDLKDLYNKCLPELAKFEIKMGQYETDAKKQELMIARFDEVLATKSNKT